MSAMFTQYALERMRQRDVGADDITGLLATVERVADNPTDPSRWGDVVRVRGDTFIVRSGDLRAVMAVEPAKQDQVVVMSVYMANADPALPMSPELEASFQSRV